MIKAIETEYNGYHFRSRLEARWAVFFDTLGIKYEYEKEGYDLGRFGRYLPDFWLPAQRCWVEIKPTYHGFDIQYAELVKQTECSLLLIMGNPWIGEYGIQFYQAIKGSCAPEWEPFGFATGRWNGEDELWIINNDTEYCLNSIADDDLLPQHDSSKLKIAYQAARSARFEYGQTPVIK